MQVVGTEEGLGIMVSLGHSWGGLDFTAFKMILGIDLWSILTPGWDWIGSEFHSKLTLKTNSLAPGMPKCSGEGRMGLRLHLCL